MAADADNVINLGPCTCTFNSVDLGHCEAVKRTMASETNEWTVEAYDPAPVGAAQGGTTLEVAMIVAETTMAILEEIMDAATLVTGTTTTGSKLTFGSVAGASVGTGTLTVVSLDATKTPDYDFTLHKAFVLKPKLVQAASAKEPAKYEVVFRALIDDSKSDGDRLGSFGKEAAAV